MKVVRVHRLENSPVVAFFDIEISSFRINNFRLLKAMARGEPCYHLEMPATRAKDGTWFQSAYPLNVETRTELTQIIIKALQDIEANKLVVEKTQSTNIVQRKLTSQEKIAISQKYLPREWAGTREEIKKMRGGIYGAMRRRNQGLDF